MDLYTDLSTLSTKKSVERLVYIGFFKNRRFVKSDKIEDREKKFSEGVDRRTDRVLSTKTEYFE